MPYTLSIPDLLSRLQIDRKHMAIELSLEADRLCRLHQYRAAITVAEDAVQMAGADSQVFGTALLYLSYARLSSNSPDQVRQATLVCDRALRALGLSMHNHAIAHLIRGQMDLQISSAASRSNALLHFQQAVDLLKKLSCLERESNHANLAAYYDILCTRIDREIETLSQAIVAAQRIEFPPRERLPRSMSVQGEETVRALRGDALVLRYLVRSLASPVLVFDLPSVSTGVTPNFLVTHRLFMQNQVFEVMAVTGHEPVRLRMRQNYRIMPIEGAPYSEAALVREQAQPDQILQYVAVAETRHQRIWIDKAEAVEDFAHIHIIGAKRDLDISDRSDALSVSGEELDIIGIIDAILTPAETQ